MQAVNRRQSAQTEPKDLRDVAIGGRIYPVDPEAVARLKQFWQKQACEESPPAVQLTPAKELVMSTAAFSANDLPADTIQELHQRYIDGGNMKTLAKEAGVSWQSLFYRFGKLGLPKRDGTQFGSKSKEKTPAPSTNGVHKETAVSPTPADTPEPDPEPPAPLAIQDQLAALQALLDQARAKEVSVSGSVKFEISAEIIF